MQQERVSPEALLREGKTIQLQPIGYSMYPLFVPGRDQAVIAPAGETMPGRGDVVLYRRDGGLLVLHRVWKRGRDGYYLVGDNEHKIEGPLRRDQISGILVGIVRKGRYFSVNNLLYRAASGLWLWLRPLRPYLARLVSGWKRRR